MGFDSVSAQQARDSKQLQDGILGLGAALVGFADMSPVTPLPYPDLFRAIAIAVQLEPDVIEAVRQGPTAEYAVEYERVNGRLNQIASTTCDIVRSFDYQAEYFPATVHGAALQDPGYQRNLRVKFQHKTAATRAGLGWIGKSAILVTPEHGPRVRLVTVFTDMPLATGRPRTTSSCGDCTECVKACPWGVIKGRLWEVSMPREFLIDAHQCRANTGAVNFDRTGAEGPCGICVAVCPAGHSTE
jgi:epoxyqueuosine reductase QueG